MYNNEVTYDKKWDTFMNKKYQKQAMELVQDRSYCCCDVPLAWAKEVNELLQEINNKYGIQYNTISYRGYTYTRNLVELLIKAPFKALFYYHTVKDWEISYAERKGKPTPKGGYRVKKNIEGFVHSIKYAFNVIKRNTVAYFYNKFRKPQVGISQVKEKYGELRVYFSAPGALDDVIEDMIRRTEIKLSKKGAYYPLESMVKWNTSWTEDGKEIKRFYYKEILDESN